MKIRNYTCAFLLLLTPILFFGQTTDSVEADVFFSQLDPARIPSGILIDKSIGVPTSFFNADGVNPESPVYTGFAALDNVWLR